MCDQVFLPFLCREQQRQQTFLVLVQIAVHKLINCMPPRGGTCVVHVISSTGILFQCRGAGKMRLM